MLGALAYALGSVHSVMMITNISFISKLLVLGVLLLISQIYTDFATKGKGSIRNILYYLGFYMVTGSMAITYNYMITRMFKF